MSSRSFSVILSARVDAYVAAMQKAAAATGLPAQQLSKLEKVGGQMQAVGRKMTTFVTLPIVGAGVAAVKAAVDWESAWTGVLKTVDGTSAELAKLETDLREMAKVSPASHAEIAAVAEAAGQLGIEVPNIAEFTRVMIGLGTATADIDAQSASMQMARFMNIMGTGQHDVERLASSIVWLGNNTAATEGEILNMAMRIAGAGVQIGMSEAEVLGLSAALTSVGIEAQMGGTAISRVMLGIAGDVATGSDRLQQFADISGMTVDQFSAAWKQDAAGTLGIFLEGLANVESQGLTTFGVIEDLGLGELRVRDTLLRSSSAREVYNRALAGSIQAFQDNIALQDEVDLRYGTMASRMSTVRNQVVDLFIDLGRMLMPLIETAVDGLSSIVGMLQSLPAPVQGAILAVGGLVAAVGPLLIVGGTLIRNWAVVNALMSASPKHSNAATRALGRITMAATAAAIVWNVLGEGHLNSRHGLDTSSDALIRNTSALFAATVAAGVAATEIDGVALAHLALSRSIAESADLGLGDSLAVLNIAGDETLDILMRLRSESYNPATRFTEMTVGAELASRAFRLTRDEGIVLADGLRGLNPDIKGLAEVFGIPEPVLRKFGAALSEVSMFAYEGREDINKLAQTYLDAAVGIGGASREAVLAAEGIAGLRHEGFNAIAVYEEFTKIVAGWTPEARAAAGVTDEMLSALEDVGPEALLAQLGIKDLGEAVVNASEAWSDYAAQSGAAMSGMDYAKNAVARLRGAFDDIYGPMDNMRAATIGIHESWDDLDDLMGKSRAKLNDYGAEFDLTTEKGREWSRTIQGTRDSIIEYGIAQLGMGKSLAEVTAGIEWNTAALREEMLQAGYTEEEVASLIWTYGLTPQQITTALRLEGERSARETIDRYIGVMEDIPAETRTEIEAAFRAGDLNFVNQTIDAWAMGATMPLRIQPIISAAHKAALRAASSVLPSGIGTLLNLASRVGHDQGAYIRRGHIAQLHDDEVVLPLSKPGRMVELLGLPQVGPRVSAALGASGGSSVSHVNETTIQVTTADQAQIAAAVRREIDDVLWRSQFVGAGR